MKGRRSRSARAGEPPPAAGLKVLGVHRVPVLKVLPVPQAVLAVRVRLVLRAQVRAVLSAQAQEVLPVLERRRVGVDSADRPHRQFPEHQRISLRVAGLDDRPASST